MPGTHPTETLDIVDEHNRVIGQGPRDLIHERNLAHRSVHLLIRGPEGKFFLQKRAETRPTHPGCWDSSVSGHIPAGMDYPDAVIKEAREEIGFDYQNPTPLLLIEASPETGYEWTMLYVHRLANNFRPRPDPEEVQELRWWTERELLDALVARPEDFAGSFRTLFFLWREARFVVPERMNDSTFAIDWDLPDLLHVKRAMLEGAGIPARVSDDYASLVPGGRGGFFNQRDPATSALCVRLEHLPDAVALLYLSRPESH